MSFAFDPKSSAKSHIHILSYMIRDGNLDHHDEYVRHMTTNQAVYVSAIEDEISKVIDICPTNYIAELNHIKNMIIAEK